MPILDMVAGFWPTAYSLKDSKSHCVQFCSFDTLCSFAVLQFAVLAVLANLIGKLLLLLLTFQFPQAQQQLPFWTLGC